MKSRTRSPVWACARGAAIVHDMIASVIGSLREAFDLASWAQWLEQLDRTFVFLLVLPFVVAIVGLWAAYRDRDREE